MTEPSEVTRFRVSDGYELHVRRWSPGTIPDTAAPAGLVLALHGIQSHSGWYGYSCRRLREAGYDVWFPDRRGSGENHAARGDAPHPDRLINDVVELLVMLNHERDQHAAEAPVVLLGISWGGKLAAGVTARRPDLVDGLALLYPGLVPRIRPSPWQRMLLKLGMLLGKQEKRVPIPLTDPTLFTAEPQWQQFIRDDPLALHQATVRFLQASVDLDRQLPSLVERIDQPTLLMLAGRDRIIDNAATQRLFERFGASDRKCLVYENAAHTLEFEPNREQIVDDLLDWLRGIQPRP